MARKELTAMEHLFKALEAAHEAFNTYLEKQDFDAAFWELEPLVGHTLSSDFKRFGRIVYDPDENTYVDEDEVKR